jgi:ABC-2 type transport system permease protein
LLLLVPLLTMRLLSEERRTGTLDLLLSAPVGSAAIVLGKYLGAMLFLSSMIALVALMPLALAIGAPLDFGKLLAGLLGLILLAGSFTAAGLYLSACTNPTGIGGGGNFGLLLLLWIVDAAGTGHKTADNLFAYLSLPRHYDALLLGLFNSADVIYYLLFIAVFLGLTIRRLDDMRLRA